MGYGALVVRSWYARGARRASAERPGRGVPEAELAAADAPGPSRVAGSSCSHRVTILDFSFHRSLAFLLPSSMFGARLHEID